MPRTKPLKSSTFRLTLAYLGLFSLSAAIILAVVYWSSTRFIDRQVRDTINEEVVWLLDQYDLPGLPGLQRLVDERSAAEPNRRAMFLLADPLGRSLAGNLGGWPTGVPDADGFLTFDVEVHGGRRPEAAASRTPPRPSVLAIDRGFRLLVGRDINDLVQTQRQMRAAILLGVGAMIVLGLLGGLILSRWMLARLERVNRSTAQDHGRRVRPADRHRRQWRRVRRAGPEPQRHARADRAAAGRACARSARTSPTTCARP